MPSPPETLRMGAGTQARLADALRQLPDVSVQTVTFVGSSVAGLDAMQRGTTNIGIIMADVAYRAFSGQEHDSTVAPFHQLRGIAVLNLNTLHFVAAAHTRISSIGDLRGLQVALGPSGSATALITELLLNSSGLAASDVRGLILPYPEVSRRLASGELDAAFMTFVPPGESVLTATGSGARLVDLEGPSIERLRLRYPFLQSTLIPGGTYPGQVNPIRTLGVDLLLVCRADLDDKVVYRLAKAYFEALQRSAPATDFERAPATPIPLHPGAARYYRERALSR